VAISKSAGAQQAAVPLSKLKKLRSLLNEPGVHQVPDAFNAMSAGIAEALGFKALYTGGATISLLDFGILDWGLITTSELIDISSRIAAPVSIPVIADADQGGETSLNVYRTVREFERRGIAGIHLEDTYNPKHAGAGASLVPDSRDKLQPMSEMLARVSAALDAKTDPDFIVIARTDALYYGLPLSVAIQRAVAFEKAGADAVFVVAMKPDQIDQIAREISIPLIGLNHSASSTQGTKLKINLWAGRSTAAILQAYLTSIQDLKDKGEMSAPPQSNPSAYALGTGQLAKTDTYHRIAERWRAVKSRAALADT
jgi:2-methylisocitrate lyase-like PEP mutase family enzyme